MELILVWAIFGVASGFIAHDRGHNAATYGLAGLLLGPIGLVLALLTKRQDPKQLPPDSE